MTTWATNSKDGGPAQQKTRILILGGGFAGLYAPIHLDRTLAKDPAVQITLINRENFSLFTPMLHEVTASDLDLTNIVNPVRRLLKRVHFFAGEVEAIDLTRKCVRVSHGFDHHHHDLAYEHIVIGLGSITNFYNLPGLAKHALTMKSLGDAIHLRNRLISLLEEADTECSAHLRKPLLTFLVAGGGSQAWKRWLGSTILCVRPLASTPTCERTCCGLC